MSLVMLVILAGCAGSVGTQTPLAGRLSVQGSTALLPLATAAAGLFQRQNPQVHLDVKGGGSLFGLTAVTSHKADIGDSDVYADPAIYPDPNLTDHIVCVIPFAMVVGPGVNVTKLTTQQIIDIFSSGKIRNWKAVGGSDLPIVPVVRPITSGTRATFRKYILGGRDEIGTSLRTDSSTAVRDTVAHTPGAIGYLALSVLNASVRAIAINNYMPTPANIEAGNYSFWSYEHMYTLGDDNKVLSSFLDFMLTPTVQQLAQRLKYIPISNMKLPVVAGPALPGTGTGNQALVI
jgi:phosphate transport system substrate-binding protein